MQVQYSAVLYIANILFLGVLVLIPLSSRPTHVHSRIALAVRGKDTQLSSLLSLFAWSHASERSGRANIAAL